MAEDDKAFVLYLGSQGFHFIPKRQLSQDEISQLREILTKNIVGKR